MKVSLFIPVYNTELFIAQTIESVLAQTFTDYELIIVDDCSTDSSYEICKSYADRDPRIKLYRNEQNLGMMPNWNRGISLATGKYFMKLDADDLIHKEFVERSFRILEEKEHVGLVCCRYVNIDASGNVTGDESDIPQWASNKEFNYGDLVQTGLNLFQYAVCRQGIGLIRKSLIDKVGVYLTIQPADSEYWFRLGAHSTFYCIDELLYFHRVWSGSDTQSTIKNNAGKFEKNIFDARNAIFNYYHSIGKLSETQYRKFIKENQFEYNKYLLSAAFKQGKVSDACRILWTQLSQAPGKTVQYYTKRILK